ncbi:hypothetical protein [Phytohabitans houttuyneae]|uniref:EcsC family protein n=1 Tax=Phytohabitans houttuyneae TaxID=1076126 RepID=A0A6V8K638_9ACTN|nr:hypothetical protein [Phytohabitans houttuyneae]GFJ77748.1 hypothetical protein Phou_019280 [Phytohabitans houttuyneae]
MTDGVPESGVDPELSKAIAELSREDVPESERKRLLRRVARAVPVRRIGTMFRPKTVVRWMADTLADVAPYIPVRDLETLRRHHDGLEGDALAERLVRNASRVTAGVGAAGGGIAAVEWAATPTLLTAPVLLAAETVAVVAVEIKLIGELHEVYGNPVPGTGPQRAMHLIHAWSQQRGFNPLMPGVGVGAVLGTAARKELRDRLLRRFGRNLTTLGPLLTGAAVAGYLNRRATQLLGDRIRDDLRQRGRGAIEGRVVD